MPSGCVSPSRTSSGVETSIVADAGSEAVLSALLKAVPKTPGRCSSARARKKSRSFFQRRSHVPRSRRFFLITGAIQIRSNEFQQQRAAAMMMTAR
jgi:hypothetical protein